MAKLTGKPKKRHEQNENKPEKVRRRQAPGRTIESRENQMISMAVDLAARQIKNGSASPAVLTHFLKLGTTRALLEKAKLENENKLLSAKTESLESQKRVEKLYANAMKAFRTYSGQEEPNDDN